MGVEISRRCLFCGYYMILMFCFSSASVVLVGNNFTLSFEDIEAGFTTPVGSSGICGSVYIPKPLDACSPLTHIVKLGGNCSSPIALIVRGGCSFEIKIRRAQNAGFEAAIIHDDEYGEALVAMAGNSAGIYIHAVFVSKATAERLKQYAGPGVEVWMFASYESSAWSIMAISFISLLAMSAMLATCFFVRRHRVRRERPQARVREFHGMSSRLVKAMPSLVFTAVTEENCTASTCAICLEDYRIGDKLRILPCRHKFHTFCVDAWLTSWRTFCPVCKRDARTSTGEPPASESTPLLSSNPSSVASTPFSSFRSSSVRSSAIQIASPSPRSRATSHNPSVASSPQIPHPLQSYHNQPSSSMSMNRSSLDLRNMSSQRSYASQYISPGSMGYPSLSPLNTRYMSPHIPSPSNASSSYLGSSSMRYMSPYIPSPSNASSSYLGSSSMRYPNPLHYSESAASFSPYDSAQSLPGC